MKTERQNGILKLLISKNSLRTDYLVKHFGVSIETIRRDINELERTGKIKKVYGGIQLASEDLFVPGLDSWGERMNARSEEKNAIANRAIELIPDHATIALDIGTTTYALSRLLGKRKGLTVITSSIQIASELSQRTDHCVYIVGGQLLKGEQITTGSFARGFLDNFAAIDLYICGADGISLESGITEFNEGVADIKRYMISISQKSILLADSKKLGKKSLFKCCSLSDIDTVVTDAQIPLHFLEGIKEQGVDVLLANTSNGA